MAAKRGRARHPRGSLILGVAMVFAFAGIVGNLIQDLAYLVLDPRVDTD